MTATPRFLTDPPRFLFFTGKGGVGKTSVACATALQLADAGARVLLVSTDPASNVGQVFGVAIGNSITAIAQVPGLDALEIDPEAAAEAYRERIVGPVRSLLPAAEIATITEQLSGSCTTEVAAFDEFTALLTDGDTTAGYDHIVFDTAPTGHTIRLLQLPGSWTDFLNEGKGDASCLGPLAGLEKQRQTYATAVAALQDPGRTRMVLVTRPQTSALVEVDRTYRELSQIGIADQHLVINGLLPARAGDEPLARAVSSRESAALAAMPGSLTELTRDTLELKAENMIGVAALRGLFTSGATEPAFLGEAGMTPPGAPLAALVADLATGDHGLVMCMGKGGVGKTTVAAAIAVALARQGHQVQLTTTDPAAHLSDTLPDAVPGLQVSRIDPVEATRAYREQVMSTKGKKLDAAGRAALAEDLLSPCTEEVAVFRQFAHAVNESRRKFVVIDTAPTGHTLLLLDAAGSYHRDVVRQLGDKVSFTTPLMNLQDPARTKIIIVTLPEPTPVLEARALQDDLQRAGIHPWAWVINNSLAAAAPTGDFLRRRAAGEAAQIAAVRGLADRVAIVPLSTSEPIGEERLADLTASVAQPV